MDARTWARWWRLIGQAGAMKVLSREWDPIGFGPNLPRDEYEFATGPVATQLRANASADQIAEVLAGLRADSLGLEPDAPADRHAALELVNWYAKAMALADDPRLRR